MIGKRGGRGAPVGALPSVPDPGDPVSDPAAFLGRCGRRLQTTLSAWKPRACRGTLLALRKNNFKVTTTLSFGGDDLVPVAAVVDTGDAPSVISEDLLPPGWRAHAWRAPTRTRIVNDSKQALKAFVRLPVTLHLHEKPMHISFIVVKRLSVPLIIGCEFQRQHTKAILPQDCKIE